MQFKKFFENNACPILVIDPVSANIVDANLAASQFYGWSLCEMRGMSLSRINAMPTKELNDIVNIAKSNGHGIYEIPHRLADGSIRFVESSATVVDVDDKSLIYSIIRDVTDRKNYAEQLLNDKKYIRDMIDAIEDIFYVFDARGNMITWNKACEKISGYAHDEIARMNALDFFTGAEVDKVASAIGAAFQGARVAEEAEYTTKSGNKIPMMFSGSVVLDASQRQVLCGVGKDISERWAAELAQQRYISLLNTTIEATADGILVVDMEGRIVCYNKKVTEMLSIPLNILERCLDKGLLDYGVSQMAHSEKFLASTLEIIRDTQRTSVDTVEFADGRVIERYSQPQRFDGQIIGRVWSFRDITERLRREQEILYLGLHDQMTGLYNRAYFTEEIKRIEAAGTLPVSIIVADINSLKLVNDVFGHDIGDKVILFVAESLRDCCRSEDMVVRYGGDEFMLVMPECSADEAEKIVDSILAQCSVGMSKDIPVSIALGIGFKNTACESISDVINRAETRMYRNKLDKGIDSRFAVLETLENIVHKKDHLTDEHSARVMTLVRGFCEYLSLDASTTGDVISVAKWHDIGKVAIDEQILGQTNKLTAVEWEVIKTHPAVGYRILRALRGVSLNVEEGVLHHHEHWDGSGYPKGLSGESIPYIARLITIVDSYDVITRDRPYRAARSCEAARAELARCAGSQFDPVLTERFLEFLNDGIGLE